MRFSTALAIQVSARNNAQKKLVADMPTMIDCLCVMIEHEIPKNNKTLDMLKNMAQGYIKYGRLHDNSVPVLKSVILQYSLDILKAMDESEVNEVVNSGVGHGDADSGDDLPF